MVDLTKTMDSWKNAHRRAVVNVTIDEEGEDFDFGSIKSEIKTDGYIKQDHPQPGEYWWDCDNDLIRIHKYKDDWVYISYFPKFLESYWSYNTEAHIDSILINGL